jgi:hypothetical protein
MANDQSTLPQPKVYRNRYGEPAKRNKKGQWEKGYSAAPAGDGSRARRELNADTIREMHAAFRRGGRKAIDKVMKQSPAIFLKLLVLLVPRDIEVTHKGGVKAMTDDQIDRAIEAIETMLAKRDAGGSAKVIEHQDMVADMGKDEKAPETPMISKGVGG